MAHIHEESETYYLDQLCLIGLSGAFGGVCLSLYFWQRGMLELMLGTQFHLWVLASGIVLVLIAVIRAGLLWTSVGARHHNHAHEDHSHHDHDHDHAHEHAHHDHDHSHHHHEHEGPCPEAGHEHAGHEHPAHDHDHDHDWAPWRYVVLLIPIMLFLIGLPNKGPQVRAMAAHVDLAPETLGYATLGDPVQQLVMAAVLAVESTGKADTLDFNTLEKASADEEDRKYWKGKRVKVKGQFARSPSNDHVFSLVRFRIRCCAADAIQLNVPMISKESVSDIKADQWVEVTGRMAFQKSRSGYMTVLQVPNRQAITPTEADSNPWVKD